MDTDDKANALLPESERVGPSDSPERTPRRRVLIMIDDGRGPPTGNPSQLRGSPVLVLAEELAIDDVQWLMCCPRLDPPPVDVGCPHHDLVPFKGTETGTEIIVGSHDNLVWEAPGGTLVFDPGRAAVSPITVELALHSWNEAFRQASERFQDGFVQAILVSREALAEDVLSWGSYILVNGEVKVGGTDTVYAGRVDDDTWMQEVIAGERLLRLERVSC